jgi:preprotein translocase subunit SecE
MLWVQVLPGLPEYKAKRRLPRTGVFARRRFSRQNKEFTLAEKKMNPIALFYRETMGELRKVSWPTRDEAMNLTMIVVVVLVAMAMFLGLIDLLGQQLLQWALGL